MVISHTDIKVFSWADIRNKEVVFSAPRIYVL